MDIELRELPADQMELVAQVDRSETVCARYHATPTEDGWGMTLRRVPVEPPNVHGHWSPEGIAQRIAAWRPQVEAGGLFVGAFRGKKFEGFAVLEAKGDDDTAELSAMFVDSRCRRQEIGSRLFAYVEDAARKRGFRAFWIASNRTESSVRFYRKQGCVLITVRDNSIIRQNGRDPRFAKAL